jgi:hypothetical protein
MVIAPVCFDILGEGGYMGMLGGHINPRTTPFKLLVSSDLALDMPF